MLAPVYYVWFQFMDRMCCVFFFFSVLVATRFLVVDTVKPVFEHRSILSVFNSFAAAQFKWANRH